MSWICPYCSHENYRLPLNSRDAPEYTGCGETYITPEDLEAQIKPQIEIAKGDLKAAQNILHEVNDHISILKDELSSWEIKKNDALREVENEMAELNKLKNFKIFREVDRDAHTRLDPHQKKLYLEVNV